MGDKMDGEVHALYLWTAKWPQTGLGTGAV